MTFLIHNILTRKYRLLDNDQSTPSQTTVYFTVASGKHVVLHWGDGSYVELTADESNHSYQHDYSAGSYVISVSGDIKGITNFRAYNQAFLSGDISNLSVLTNLTYLRLSSTSVSGDISNLSGLTSLSTLYLYSTSVSGDISNLSGLTSLSTLFLNSTSVSGDISNLSVLTNLTSLYLYSTSLSYGSVALPAWASNNIRIDSCGLDATEVDNFLIDLADGVGADGTLNISGTNASRTAASDAAKAALIAAGWDVTVNE